MLFLENNGVVIGLFLIITILLLNRIVHNIFGERGVLVEIY